MKRITWMLVSLFVGYQAQSQIGIGNSDPDPSSILDVRSNNKGMLAPRMTTAERNAIASPANGLLVYDTSLASFYYYSTSTTGWIKVNNDREGRTKYKLIKSTDVLANVLSAERTAGGNTRYLLDTNTFYEINGTVNLDLPIELNNAYISGVDSGEDKLVRASGDLFTGSTGGSIRFLTITATGGSVFNLTGSGQTQMLIHRDCFMSGSASIGKIENFGLVFVSILQYVGNSAGITYRNINRLLISNAAWFAQNSGTFEKLEGTFGLVTKQGGFIEVTGGNVGFDVSANPIITGEAVMQGTVFTGNTTGSGAYVKGYSPTIFPGFFFNNNWTVDCPGVPTERDAVATGTVYLNRLGAAQAKTYPALNTPTKLTITAPVGSNMFRANNAAAADRITYTGKKGRNFELSAQLSFDVTQEVILGASSDYTFYFVRIPSGTNTPEAIISTESYTDTTGGMQAVGLQGITYLNTGDSVEVWIRRTSGAYSITLKSFTMTIN